MEDHEEEVHEEEVPKALASTRDTDGEIGWSAEHPDKLVESRRLPAPRRLPPPASPDGSSYNPASSSSVVLTSLGSSTPTEEYLALGWTTSEPSDPSARPDPSESRRHSTGISDTTADDGMVYARQPTIKERRAARAAARTGTARCIAGSAAGSPSLSPRSPLSSPPGSSRSAPSSTLGTPMGTPRSPLGTPRSTLSSPLGSARSPRSPLGSPRPLEDETVVRV